MSKLQKPPETHTEEKVPILGGVIGGLGGWLLLYFSMHSLTRFVEPGNFFRELIAVVWSLVNLVGCFGFPLLGFCLGMRHGFTVTRTSFRR